MATEAAFPTTFVAPIPAVDAARKGLTNPLHLHRPQFQVARCTLEPPPKKPAVPTPVPVKSPKSSSSAIEPPSLLDVLAERTVDTLDDVKMHFARFVRNLDSKEEKKPVARPRVIVLGSGWAAHSFIKVIDEEAYDVAVVSPRNYYFFTPLLAATAVGTIEFRSVVDPIRRANPLVSYYEAECVGIDLENASIECNPVTNGGEARERQPFRLDYDYLLIAIGESTGTFGIPGVREHAYFLKEITDSIKLRRAIVRTFESAALPGLSDEQRRDILHFVVVGGGPTGCEFAGELSDFVLKDLRVKYSRLIQYVRVTLLQSQSSILSQFEKRLQDRALANFESQNINVQLNSRVSLVSDTHVHLSDDRAIRYGLLIWAAGNSPRSLTKNLIAQINENSEEQPFPRKLTVDPWLRVAGAKSAVFALGDCSLLPDAPLPATAQVAGQQGAYLARCLRKWKTANVKRAKESEEKGVDLEPVVWEEAIKPFRFLSLGLMSYIGNERAIVQVEAGPEKNFAMSGFLSYLLWASTYAVKQVATRNRVLVLFDWFKSRVFGRDISQF